MKRKYSLAHLTVLTCPPPEMIYIAKEAGYDFVSIRPIYMGLPGEPNYDLVSNSALLAETLEALENTGLMVHDIELAKITDEVPVEKYFPAMKLCSEKMGAKSIISSVWTNDRESAIEKLRKLADFAKTCNMTVELEFVTIATINNLEQAVSLLKEVDRKNIGLLIDTLHLQRSVVQIKELDEIPKEMFRMAHLADCGNDIPMSKDHYIHTLREARLYVGEGIIDIKSIVDKLGEDVVMSIELPHLARTAEYGAAEHARKCLETAKKYLGDN